MNSLAQRLQTAIIEEERGLRAIPEASTAAKSKPAAWSKKQELGHLIDSATNNRVRFIKAALQGAYAGPSYDGNGWVAMGGYHEMPWSTLIDLWKALNHALVAVVERIPDERLSAECRIGDAQPVTLEFVIDDYILHMQHHLDHILAREHPTAYPGAAIGV
jgi:hypothetical protein